MDLEDNFRADYNRSENNLDLKTEGAKRGGMEVSSMYPYEEDDIIEMVPSGRRKRRSFLPGLFLVLLCGIAGYCGAAFAIHREGADGAAEKEKVVIYQTAGDSVKAASAGELDVTYVASQAIDSVVEISTETVQTSGFYSQYVTTGAGSGVIITQDGYIATNNHVIEGARTIEVRLHDGTVIPAVLVAADAKTDLAVIKVAAEGLKPAVFGTSGTLAVGQRVVAIGNPLGRLGGTVTDGIISAKDREISIDGEHMTLLQTNAAVNPGNSGGGLFDGTGALIGIVNSKSAGSDVEGLGFAIPSDTARNVLEQLITSGYVSGRPALGMEVAEITSYRDAFYSGISRLGVYVTDGKNTGLSKGDFLLAIDGTDIETMTDVKAALSKKAPGDTVEIEYVHGNRQRRSEIVLTEEVPEGQSGRS